MHKMQCTQHFLLWQSDLRDRDSCTHLGGGGKSGLEKTDYPIVRDK